MVHNIEINIPETVADIAEVKRLFLEYADFLNVDLCFQGFDKEMEVFPATYECLLLAKVDGKPAAAVGLKDLGDGVCEMKRLYARDDYRGLGLGKRLCDDIVGEARRRGFKSMRLDTLQRLKAAIAIYRDYGFVEIDKYYDNPEEGVIYMELRL